MVTVLGIWENGYNYDQRQLEKRMWSQIVGAFQVKEWHMAENSKELGGLIEKSVGLRVFWLPEKTIDAYKNKPMISRPGEQHAASIVHIFGNGNENLIKFIRDQDMVATILTPFPADMFAVTCLPLVLYGAN